MLYDNLTEFPAIQLLRDPFNLEMFYTYSPCLTDSSRKVVAISQRGFTLVELIVIMIVIGILAAVAVPRFSLLSGYDEIGYRDQVKATLEFARKAAVAQRRYVCVERPVLSPNSLSVTIDTDIPENRTGSLGTCTRQQPLVLPGGSSNQINPRGSITLLPSSTQSLIFDALGRASVTATFKVQGDAEHDIFVVQETGYVYGS